MLVQIRPIYGFIIGVLLASIFPLEVLLLSPLYLILVAFVAPKQIILALAFMLGLIWVCTHWFIADKQAWPESAGKIELTLKGRVENLTFEANKTGFDFYTQGPHFEKLKVSCYYCPYVLNPSQTWIFNLRIKPIHAFANPQGFDYRKWMLTKGYTAQAYVNVKSTQNRVINDTQNVLKVTVSDMFAWDELPILRALVLGDKSSIPADIKRTIYSLGISHLFVVSGLHIGIMGAFIGLIVYWLQRPLLLFHWCYAKEVAVFFSVLAAFCYGYLSGFQVPALRAFFMLFCAGVFVISSRHIHVLNYLIAGFIGTVFLYPIAFMDMGSWLSFSIVGALIIGLSGYRKLPWYMGLLKVQWLAFCVGGLVLIGFGQGVVPGAFLVNLLLIPIFSLILMPLIVVAVILYGLFSIQLFSEIEYGLNLIFQLLELGKAFLSWWLPIHEGNVLLICLSLILLVLPVGLALTRLAVAVLVIGLLLPVNRSHSGGFRLTVLDVGQGSAAVVETTNRTIVVDTGARFMNGATLADMVVMPYLRQKVIRSVDLLHLTHNDNDHAGGKNQLIPFTNEVITQNACKNEQWEWDGVLFERFQSPDHYEGNNGSCLLKITSTGKQSVLFTGDIEQEAEDKLISRFSQTLKSDVMIVPHHGSKTSSSDNFLDVVDAHTAIISAGFLNRYGHPHEQTLIKLTDRNLSVYTTFINGALQVDFPPRQAALVVSTYRP
ncbi:DNA internalization-related competence protein ComEC/Rec2 [Oceaniserpentilla sp. 4NH20-0058]|uniref:DNA internalization-related competence protein ComEC/Rec2 n=1 Tax=Oceaniserpentilla sp. 4NH20-0058 TaxID=3127660 RepID=UPI0031053FD5